MTNPLILLHKDDDNSPVVININHIISIERNTDEYTTTVYCVDNNSVEIKESPERVYNMVVKLLNTK